MNRYFTHEKILGGKVILTLDHYNYGQLGRVGDFLEFLIIMPLVINDWFTNLLNERRRKTKKGKSKRKS